MCPSSFTDPAKILLEPDLHLSNDGRTPVLDEAMKRHQHQPDSLIEVLHTAQDLWGCLEESVLHYIARHLQLPPSHVYGVATFYHLFSFAPPGTHSCVVCMGTACHVKGADAVLAVLEGALTQVDDSTPDKPFSLETARCLGVCGSAPVVVVDNTIMGHQTPESTLNRVKEYL